MNHLLLTALLASTFCMTGCVVWSKEAKPETKTAVSPEPGPLDHRARIESTNFKQQPDGAWESQAVTPPFPFDEMIYSWHMALKPEEGFRLFVRATLHDDTQTDWQYAGYWGGVNVQEQMDPKTKKRIARERPKFKGGMVDYDVLTLDRPGKSFAFRVVSEGAAPLKTAPLMHAIATLKRPSATMAAQFAPAPPTRIDAARVLDLPLRKQENGWGNPMPDRCQTAALATALEYHGTSKTIEDLILWTEDPEYDIKGIWPRVTGAASQLGHGSRIERFRDWAAVRAALAKNEIILCSMAMSAAKATYIDPPYPKMSGHIVVLNGITEDGRVIITDSALGKMNRGFQSQWLAVDFEKVWFAKGGVAMVIEPPKDAPMKLVKDLPPFPIGRVRKP